MNLCSAVGRSENLAEGGGGGGSTASKVSFFVQRTNMQLITIQNFNIQTYDSHCFWFFSLKCRFKSQIIFRILLSLPNANKLICFDRNIKGNRDVTFLECDYLRVQRCVKLTLPITNKFYLFEKMFINI